MNRDRATLILPGLLILMSACLPDLMRATSSQSEFTRGEALYAERLFEEAFEAYKAALAKDIDNPDILERLGDTSFKLKKVDKALEFYLEAERYGPRDGFLLTKIGGIYYLKSDEQKAIDYLKRAARLDEPRAQQALKGKGLTW